MLTRFEFKDLDAMVITSEPERADTNWKLKMLAQKAGARGSPKQTKNKKRKRKETEKRKMKNDQGTKKGQCFQM